MKPALASARSEVLWTIYGAVMRKKQARSDSGPNRQKGSHPSSITVVAKGLSASRGRAATTTAEDGRKRAAWRLGNTRSRPGGRDTRAPPVRRARQGDYSTFSVMLYQVA